MTSQLDAFALELQRLYGLERELRTELDTLRGDVAIDSLDMVLLEECRIELGNRLEAHREETDTHVERLESVFEALDREPTAGPTPELDGWVRDKERFNNVILNDELRPIYYLTATLKLEEIERTAYESALAAGSGLDSSALPADRDALLKPLETTLEEEVAMLEDLESIADSESVSQLLDASTPDWANRTAFYRARHQ